jgi:plastocyanin domain-containing protein
VLVAVLGVVMFTHGLNLFGVNLGLPPARGSSIAVAQIADGVQTVRTPIESGRYFPFVVQAGVPVRWVIQAKEDDLNGCNEIVTVPEYGIRKQLVPGENVIEFTPKRVGTVGYTCWMGMISSSIRVVSDLAALSADDLKTPPPNQVQPGAVQPGAVQPGGDIAGAFPGGQGGGGGCCAGSSNPRFAGGRVPTENIGLARISGDEQVVDIRVDDQGYTPAVVVLQRNVKAKIRFIPAKLSSCNAVVAFPAYQGSLNLGQGRTETPWLETVEDYTFQCGMGMLHGYVKVVDDLSRVDLVAVRQQVSAFKASSSGGGCCGQ